MLKRLFFCIKLQILHYFCTTYIVLLDFLKPHPLAFVFMLSFILLIYHGLCVTPPPRLAFAICGRRQTALFL